MNRQGLARIAALLPIVAVLAPGSFSSGRILADKVMDSTESAAFASRGDIAGSSQLQTAAPADSGPLKLQIRLGDGRSQFHLGEIIPIELSFSSPERRTYQIASGLPATQEDEYRFEPAGFSGRESEFIAAGRMFLSNGRRGVTAIDPGEKAFQLQDTLNRLFSMQQPGKYRVSVISRRFGFPVTSNQLELEILPSDPTWEYAELARGSQLLQAPVGKPAHDHGCEIIRSLGTHAAQLEMAAVYGNRGLCGQEFEIGLISAPDRQAVLGVLEEGLLAPDRAVHAGLLRTMAYVRAYQQHPELYPAPRAAGPAPAFNFKAVSEAFATHELHYAMLLTSHLPNKTVKARAASLLTLLYLGRTLTGATIPPQIVTTVREQMPAVFGELTEFEQEYALRQRWPQLKGPAMVPALKHIVMGLSRGAGTQTLALLRLSEMSPGDARPFLLREVQSQYPRLGLEVLGLLPEKELPELDSPLLERVNQRLPYGDGGLVVAAGLLQRYASPAIAESLRILLLKDGIGKMECESEAHLLAYLLRVDSRSGEGLLRQELRGRGRAGCLLLRRLAQIRMSPEVEAAAMDELDSPEIEDVLEALYVLQLHGSPQSKAVLLSHYRDWRAAWISRASELELPRNRDLAGLEMNYFTTLSAAQGWLCSDQDIRTLQELCVTQRCKEAASGLLNYLSSMRFLIQFGEPSGNDVVERVGLAPYYYVIETMDRLKQKLTQFSKGTVFWLDTRGKDREAIERIYDELKSWAIANGFDVRQYHE